MLKKRQFAKILWISMIICCWEMIAVFGGVNPLLFPSFSSVMEALASGIFSGDLSIQLIQSLGVVIAGLALGLILAVIMAYFDYFHPMLHSLLDLLASALHPLPGVALLPVVVLWVGVGFKAVFIIVVHAGVWSLFLNIKLGFRTVDRTLIESAHTEGASNRQLFRHVLMPCSKQALLTGLQIGWSRGWRALISAEMIFGAISAMGGIGWYIYERRAFMDTPGIYAGILLVVLVGVVVEQLLFGRIMNKE